MKLPCLFAGALALFTVSVLAQDAAPATAARATIAPAPAPDKVTDLPSIFIISDSTANNNANGGLGWGKPFADYFDPAKVRIVNKAIAARSSRSYIVEGHWDQVLPTIKAGDFVLLQFGHNDTGTPNENPRGDRPSLPGLGEETADMANAGSHRPETVHTYGWYMRKYVADAQAKGAHVVILTVTVRDIWTNPNAEFGKGVSETATIVTKKDDYNPADDKVERGLDDGHGHNFAEESRQLAAAQHVPLVDLTTINADKFDKQGREKTMLLFQTRNVDHTHTNPTGADFNANSIVSGLKALKNSPFTSLLSDKGKTVEPANAKYVADNPAPAQAAAAPTTSTK